MSDIIDILTKTKAILIDDHFVFSSGLHSNVYINKDAMYPHTLELSRVGGLFAKALEPYQFETICAPAIGGILLSSWTSFHCSVLRKRSIAGVYAEKDGEGSFHFTRGYDTYIKGKRVAILEDMVTTGGSVKKVVDVVRAAGGDVQVVAVMIDRSSGVVSSDMFDAPFVSLGAFEGKTWQPGECELCQQGMLVNTTVGHGKKFVASQGL